MKNRRKFYWLLMAAAAVAVAFAPLPSVAFLAGSETRTYHIEASQYAYSPGELHVNLGDTVTIELTSIDVAHGLYVDGYGASTQSDPGQTTSLTFVANRAGSFRFRCNVTCGALHPFMIGKLTVGNNTGLYRGIGLTLLGAIGLMISRRTTSDGGMLV
jgi:heme/copper-type cytochrome/quinol oxidase subunit 2